MGTVNRQIANGRQGVTDEVVFCHYCQLQLSFKRMLTGIDPCLEWETANIYSRF